jgi:uncharacterized membrane protein YdfJ with MMPL/SSD domain
MFTAVAAFFCFLLAPTNQMSYDTQQFHNGALAAVAGVGAAALSLRLLPPCHRCCGPAGFWLLRFGICGVWSRARSHGRPMVGRNASMAASAYCRTRPSRYSAQSFWRRSQ